MPLPCPCGLPAAYDACCGRYHREFHASGRLSAPDAEALMRSRYSAYVRDELDYLLASWHPSTRPPRLDPNPPGLRWLGLELQSHARQDDAHATVRFVARSKLGGRAQRLVECSRFERVDGAWLYVDAE